MFRKIQFKCDNVTTIEIGRKLDTRDFYSENIVFYRDINLFRARVTIQVFNSMLTRTIVGYKYDVKSGNICFIGKFRLWIFIGD